MNPKHLTVPITLLLIGAVLSGTVLAAVSVGVKKGDWVKYGFEYTGSPDQQNPDWIKIDFNEIDGTSITAELTGQDLAGASDRMTSDFDLETGAPTLVLIPANLDEGDEFYHEDYGTITISAIEQCTYCGAKRTVLCATFSPSSNQEADIRWDRTTGILLQTDQNADDFTQKLLITDTNMWQPQILGIDMTLFYLLVIAAIVIVAVLGTVLFRKKRSSQQTDLTT